MATSAKRTPMSNASTSSREPTHSNRLYRSLSRLSRPRRTGDEFHHPSPPRTSLVNAVRGSDFSETSVDDVAIQLFDATESNSDGGRLASTIKDSRKGEGPRDSQRRGRSVSRQSFIVSGIERRQSIGFSQGGRRQNSGGNSRRKRSVSVVRYDQVSDSESDPDHCQKSNDYANQRSNQMPMSNVQAASALTDDEGREVCSYKNGIERTIRTVYTQKAEHPDDKNGGLYKVMRRELRNAVEEIKTELEHTMTTKRSSDSAGDDCLHTQSADFLERSNGRSRLPKQLNEEEEKHIEDFISSLEDTEFSSFDDERSDTSSTLGGFWKSGTFQSPVMYKTSSAEMEGVALPWLQWETSTDASPLGCKNNMSAVQRSNFLSVAQDSTRGGPDVSDHSMSSHGSWSIGVDHDVRNSVDTTSKSRESGVYSNQFSYGGTKKLLQYDVDEYLERQSFDEEFLYERLKQQQLSHSGRLLLCNQIWF